NADNLALAALSEKLPFEVASTAYEKDRSALLSMVDSMAYFVYKEGGEPVAPFFNIHGGAALKEVRESGRFTELPIARNLPDGGIAHVFENRSPGRLISTGSFIRASIEPSDDSDVTFAGKLQLTG